MESNLHRRSPTEPRATERSPERAPATDAGSPTGEFAWPVLLRVPDLNRPVVEPAKPTAAPVEPEVSAQPAATDTVLSSALYESHSPVEQEPTVAAAPAQEAVQPVSAAKTWRTDNKHEPFRPEKYNSNLTTKLVAGSLSLGAVVLVYFALFGGGSDSNSDAETDYKVTEIEEKWTDDHGELEVDLGSEAGISESSPLAPPLTSQVAPREATPAPVPAVAPAPSVARVPRQDIPQEARPPVSAQAEYPQTNMPAEAAQPGSASLTDVLPWRQNEAMTESQSNSPTPAEPRQSEAYAPAETGVGLNAPAYAPAETGVGLNAPLTQTAPTQPSYAGGYPTTVTPAAPQYPATNYQSAPDVGGSTYGGYDPATAAAPAQGQAAAYQAQNPYPQTGAAQPWNRQGGNTAGGGYPTTSAPNQNYAPANSRTYPQTNNTETPREWRR